MSKFNWKKKTAIFIGRFQPFHNGHKQIFLKALKKNRQVAILVMNSHKINKKNPYDFKFVKKKISLSLKSTKKNMLLLKFLLCQRLFTVGKLVIK